MTESKRINLALQGGGSHGAFTWGVLDALLEDGRIELDGITGASAGSMNAAVLAHGWLDGVAAGGDPRASARAALRRFWDAIGAQPSLFALSSGRDPSMPRALDGSFWYAWVDLLTRMYSPYQLNPLNINPLRGILDQQIDIDRLRATAPFKLFVCATNVRTGRIRIFRESELTIDMLLASACLPFTFQAVAVDGEHYWDGGYMGNPALFPLFYASHVPDLLLVQINPLVRDDVPDTAGEIIDRVNEITFNASLFQELRAIAFVQRLLGEQRLDAQRYRQIYFHRIAAEERMKTYGASSKSNTSPGFLNELFELGRKTAADWLELNVDYIGHTSSTRIEETFL